MKTPAAGVPTTKTTKTATIATPAASPGDALAQLRHRVVQNHAVLQHGIDELREASEQRFDSLNTTLNEILAKLSTTTVTTSTEVPAVSLATSAQAASRRSTDTFISEASFAGFQQQNVRAPTSGTSTHGRVYHDADRHSELSDDNVHVARQSLHKLHSLPRFSGASEQWPKFIMRYKQTTEAYGYSAIDNSLRLQECLEGEALDAVDSMLNDGSQTDAVIEELESRFGRPELLAQTQLHRVREVQPIPEERPELMVPYASRVRNMVAYIDQPKTRKYLENPELLEELVMKMPLSRRHKWGEYACTLEPEASLHDFAQWLKAQATSISKMTPAAVLAAATLPTIQTTVPARQAAKPPMQQRRDRINVAAMSRESYCGVCDNSSHDIGQCRRIDRMEVDERWDIAREKHLCFSCLKHGHGLANCNAREVCGINGCTRPHHQLLHAPNESDTSSGSAVAGTSEGHRNPFNRRTAQNEQSIESVPACTREEIERINTSQTDSTNTMYRIVPVTLHGANRSIQTFAYLDNGSSISVVEDKLADELQLSGHLSPMELEVYSGLCMTERSRIVTLGISGMRNTAKFGINVRTVRKLMLPTQTLCMQDLVTRFDYLRGLPVDSYEQAMPRILIGLDNVHLGVSTRTIMRDESGLVATCTKLGWVVCGKTSPGPELSGGVEFETQSEDTHMYGIDQMIRDDIDLQIFGVRHFDNVLVSRDDARTREIGTRTTAQRGDHHETELPWRNDSTNLPASHDDMAMRRLPAVERSTKRDSTFASEYAALMDGDVQKAYARLLTTEKAAQDHERVWYGPIQIRIREKGVDAQQSLWRSAFSPCCAQNVKSLNVDKYEEQFPTAVRWLYDDVRYIDHFVASFDMEIEAARGTKEIEEVYKHGGFEWRGFLSSSETVLREIGELRANDTTVNIALDTSAPKTNIADWYWWPTALYVTDDEEDEEHWPQDPALSPCVDGADEVKPRTAQMVCTVTSSNTLVQITCFSHFHKFRYMAYVLWYIRIPLPRTRRSGELQPDELEEAERRLVIASQANEFAAEIDAIKSARESDQRSALRTLLKHIDGQCLLRVTGRLDLASLIMAAVHRRLRHQY